MCEKETDVNKNTSTRMVIKNMCKKDAIITYKILKLLKVYFNVNIQEVQMKIK